MESKNLRTIKEAISLALNDKSLLNERNLRRKMNSKTIDQKSNYREHKLKDQRNSQRSFIKKHDNKRDETYRSRFCTYCKQRGHEEPFCREKKKGIKFSRSLKPNSTADKKTGGAEGIGRRSGGLIRSVRIRRCGLGDQVLHLRPGGTRRAVRLLIDSGAQASIIKKDALDFANCFPKKDESKNVIMRNSKIALLGTCKLDIQNKMNEFLVADKKFIT